MEKMFEKIISEGKKSGKSVEAVSYTHLKEAGRRWRWRTSPGLFSGTHGGMTADLPCFKREEWHEIILHAL